jgi:tetratricopeptide (TPR) repeat protein
VRLALVRERYDLALSGVERVRARYGDSALLCYYEGESLLRVASLPRDVVRAMEARNGNDRRDEEPDLHARRRLRAGVPPQLAQAEQSFQLALEKDPALADARRGLGEVQLLNGDLAAAKATLGEYLAANPAAPDARLVAKMLAMAQAPPGASTEP